MLLVAGLNWCCTALELPFFGVWRVGLGIILGCSRRNWLCGTRDCSICTVSTERGCWRQIPNQPGGNLFNKTLLNNPPFHPPHSNTGAGFCREWNNLPKTILSFWKWAAITRGGHPCESPLLIRSEVISSFPSCPKSLYFFPPGVGEKETTGNSYSTTCKQMSRSKCEMGIVEAVEWALHGMQSLALEWVWKLDDVEEGATSLLQDPAGKWRKSSPCSSSPEVHRHNPQTSISHG